MKISRLLCNITKKNNEDKISIENILQTNKESSYFIIFLMAVLSLIPTPFPFPIFSSVFGGVLILLSLQMLFGVNDLKLPKMIKNFSIKRTFVAIITEKSATFLRRIEILSKPRLKFYKNKYVLILINFLIFISSICITIPIPLTNTLPAIAIIIITFGLLNNDGLFVIIGIIASIVGISFFILGLIYGKKVIKMLTNLIKF